MDAWLPLMGGYAGGVVVTFLLTGIGHWQDIKADRDKLAFLTVLCLMTAVAWPWALWVYIRFEKERRRQWAEDLRAENAATKPERITLGSLPPGVNVRCATCKQILTKPFHICSVCGPISKLEFENTTDAAVNISGAAFGHVVEPDNGRKQ